MRLLFFFLFEVASRDRRTFLSDAFGFLWRSGGNHNRYNSWLKFFAYIRWCFAFVNGDYVTKSHRRVFMIYRNNHSALHPTTLADITRIAVLKPFIKAVSSSIFA